MKLNDKLAALDHVYQIYDNFVSGLDLACRKSCAHCCTNAIALTTIEGYKIIQQLEATGGERWLVKIAQAANQPHFQLKMTTNQLANLCAEGIEPPVEENADWRPCPLLNENQCPIYAVRPFGCRCLVSRCDCSKNGYADMDDFVLSVNTVFLQSIEHLDADGCTGNLLDMLGVMASGKNQHQYQNNSLNCAKAGTIPNQPLKVLMIPPEHRTRMQPILQSLREIRI